jgi:hypothetical protein
MGKLACILGFVLATACVANARQTEVEYLLRPDRAIGPPLVGVGVQMNPWLYCAPNWGDVTDANVKDLERKVIELAPQHVRIFLELKWWDANADPKVRESFVRVCRLAARSGASINATLWRGWGGKNTPQVATRMADVLQELLAKDDLQAIRYITLQNEPNSTKIPIKSYLELYRKFDEALRARNIRDHFEIVGGDLLGNDQDPWFNAMADHLNDVLDGWSVHMYWEYWDTDHIYNRLNSARLIIDKIAPDHRKPMHLTEFGVRGLGFPKERPGHFVDGRPMLDTITHPMECAMAILEAMNMGYVSMLQWDAYDIRYDRSLMETGVIGQPKDGWPLKPGYDLLRLFTHTTRPHWQAIDVQGSRSQQRIAAVRGSNGQITVFALNCSDQPTAFTIGGLPKGDWFAQSWNEQGNGKMSKAAPAFVAADGIAEVRVAPMSLTALFNHSLDR